MSIFHLQRLHTSQPPSIQPSPLPQTGRLIRNQNTILQQEMLETTSTQTGTVCVCVRMCACMFIHQSSHLFLFSQWVWIRAKREACLGGSCLRAEFSGGLEPAACTDLPPTHSLGRKMSPTRRTSKRKRAQGLTAIPLSAVPYAPPTQGWGTWVPTQG